MHLVSALIVSPSKKGSFWAFAFYQPRKGIVYPRPNYSGPQCSCKHEEDMLQYAPFTFGTIHNASERTKTISIIRLSRKYLSMFCPSLCLIPSIHSPFHPRPLHAPRKSPVTLCRLNLNIYTLPCTDFEAQSFIESSKPTSQAIHHQKWHQALSTRSPAPSSPSLTWGNNPPPRQ